MGKPESAIGAWCRLLRVPNYFTVPGDVLAGYVLAGGVLALPWGLAAVVLVSLCLYAFGILLNDLADATDDRRDRPGRPLPSGAVGMGPARAAAAGVLVVAMGVVGAVVPQVVIPAGGLAGMIAAYDLGLKRIPVVGELSIACCRVLNLLLGAWVIRTAPFPVAVWVGAAVLFAYVFGLALLARNEIRTGAAPLVGALVRGLILVQAILIAAGGAYLMGAAVATLWIPATWLGRRFYSS